MWVLHVQGPSAGAGELSEESMGVSCPTSQPTHLATVFDLSLFQAPYTTFFSPRQSLTTGGLLLLLPGGKQSDITQRFWGDTEKHQCTFAYGLKTSTVVNRNHSLQPGQSTGILGRQVVRTKMLVWELATLSSFSHPPVRFFPSSNPLTFPFLSYIIFSKMWNSRKDFRRGQVILFFSLLSFKVYCIITYIITKANITIFKTSLIYSPCF